MMSQFASEKERIFAAAAELPTPQQRKAFLDAACASNATLRQEVEELLKHDNLAASFLGSPAVQPRLTEEFPAITERPGLEVGPYKLLEQIGEGGFGVVFMAEQMHPVRRKVALKVIKPGMDTRQVIARFEAERQALALMDHPNIARVLDAGETSTGRPYFVMELVKGIPITQYCDEAQLPARERLSLFVSVCHAVQHAHQKGIIHRDLKPTNVLVTLHDGTPVVKVIDFGVAKATGHQLTEKTLFTGFAQMIGTPLYMSPEQAALSGLDIDTRSDIYSLGVLLYELLTGTTPLAGEQFKQAAFDEIRRLIREEEPPKPSTRILTMGASASTISAQRKTEPHKLQQLLRNELDWIVMRALEKDRTRRYETAVGLARDVQRYLEDQPVEACPPSPIYRLSKFVRRNKIAFVSGSLVASALLLGTVVSVAFAITAYRHRAQEMLARKDAQDHLKSAERQRRVAEDATATAQAESEERRKAIIAAQEATARETRAKEEQVVLREEAVRQKTEIEQQKSAIEGLNQQLRQSLNDSQRSLYSAQMNLIPAAWESNNIARVQDILQATRPLPGHEDLRGFEWFYWNRQCNSELQTVKLENIQGYLGHPWFSADGSRFATVTLRNSSEPLELPLPPELRRELRNNGVFVRVWDTTTGKEVWAHHYLPSYASPERDRARGYFYSHGACLNPNGRRVTIWVLPQIPPGIWRQTEGRPNTDPFKGEMPQLEIVTFEVGRPEPVAVIQIPLARPGEYPTPYKDIEVNRDGSRVLTTVILPESGTETAQGTLQLWNTEDGRQVAKVELAPPPGSFPNPTSGSRVDLDSSVNDNGSRIAVCLASKVSVWNAEDGQVVRELTETPANIVALSPDGSRLVTVSSTTSSASRIHDLTTGRSVTLGGVYGESITRVSATGESVTYGAVDDLSSLAFSPDGRWLAARSPEFPNCVQIYFATGVKGPLVKGHSARVSRAQFTQDGSRLMTAAENGEIKTWAVAPTSSIPTDTPYQRDGRRYLLRGESTISPDGASVATAVPLNSSVSPQDLSARRAASQRVTLRQLPSGRVVRSIKTAGTGQRLSYCARGNRLVIASCTDDGDLNTAGEIQVIQTATGQPVGESLRVPAAEYSQIHHWTGSETPVVTRFSPAASLSADGSLLAFTRLSQENGKTRSALELVAVDSGETITTGPTVDGILDDWKFSSDGSKLLARLKSLPISSSGDLAVYDAGTGRPKWTAAISVGSVAFHGEGQKISGVIKDVAFREGVSFTYKCWDAEDGTELVSTNLPWSSKVELFTQSVFKVSPDGRLVAAAIAPRSGPGESTIVPPVQVLDAKTGTILFELQGHSAPVTEIAFMPDSRRIVTTTGAKGGRPGNQSLKGETKFWDAHSGQELLNLDVPLAELTFTSGGFWLIGEQRSSVNSRIASWDAAPVETAQLVERLLSQRQNGLPLSRVEIQRRLQADAALGAIAQTVAERVILQFRGGWQAITPQDMFAICKVPSHDPSDYRRALELATEAGETAPDSRSWWNLRGYAHYRLGQYAEAQTALERASEIQAQAGTPPVLMSHVFQAMTLHKLGRPDKAREILLGAEQIPRTTPAAENDWQLVAGEAANLLGIKLETLSTSPPDKE